MRGDKHERRPHRESDRHSAFDFFFVQWSTGHGKIKKIFRQRP